MASFSHSPYSLFCLSITLLLCLITMFSKMLHDPAIAHAQNLGLWSPAISQPQNPGSVFYEGGRQKKLSRLSSRTFNNHDSGTPMS